MNKKTVALLFGGVSSEYDVSCMSVSSVWENIDREKFEPVLLGITKTGEWYLYSGDIEKVRSREWDKDSENLKKAFICPDRRVHGAMVESDRFLVSEPIAIGEGDQITFGPARLGAPVLGFFYDEQGNPLALIDYKNIEIAHTFKEGMVMASVMSHLSAVPAGSNHDALTTLGAGLP